MHQLLWSATDDASEWITRYATKVTSAAAVIHAPTSYQRYPTPNCNRVNNRSQQRQQQDEEEEEDNDHDDGCIDQALSALLLRSLVEAQKRRRQLACRHVLEETLGLDVQSLYDL